MSIDRMTQLIRFVAIVLVPFSTMAHPEPGNACAEADAELGQLMSSHEVRERVQSLRELMEKAIATSGQTPHELVVGLFIEPPTIASAHPAASALLPEPMALEVLVTGAKPLDSVIARLGQIHEQLDVALAEVTDQHAIRLGGLLPEMLERTSTGSDLEELEHGPVLVEIQSSIDQSALKHAAALLAGLAQDKVATALAEHFGDTSTRSVPNWLEAQVTGPVIFAERTELGIVIIGGPGSNIYTGPAALIIDTGGDDVYALPGGDRVRVIIDLAGDDSYSGQSEGALGASVLGAGLIADHAGNDIYAGGRITQGASVAGIGMLHDRAGNDRYFAAELAQGASLAGIGALVDSAGDDIYTAAKFAQGYGGALGVGSLIDEAGNDAYLAGHRHPSSYGVPGNFQAFSQGVGMGFRNDVAGGIGLLRDDGGHDRYIAGNFSQGTGYYLGAGLLLDGQGDDTYAGGRFTQGAAAHLGAGLLRDAAGNDVYSGSTSASQAGAWDMAIAALVDCAGDDAYSANEFGLGSAAQNAIALFVDAAGKNRYEAGRHSKGHSGPTDDHADVNRVGNLAVFISGNITRAPPDAGTGEDR